MIDRDPPVLRRTVESSKGTAEMKPSYSTKEKSQKRDNGSEAHMLYATAQFTHKHIYHNLRVLMVLPNLRVA